jgi:hypothetical protein
VSECARVIEGSQHRPSPKFSFLYYSTHHISKQKSKSYHATCPRDKRPFSFQTHPRPRSPHPSTHPSMHIIEAMLFAKCKCVCSVVFCGVVCCVVVLSCCVDPFFFFCVNDIIPHESAVRSSVFCILVFVSIFFLPRILGAAAGAKIT